MTAEEKVDRVPDSPMRRTQALWVTALFVVVGGVGMARHELWRDEAFTWLIVRDSPSPAALWANLDAQFTGHPRAYFFLAWLLGVAGSYWPLRVVNLATMAAAVFLFSRKAPFTALQRALFAFGFFPLYQYGVFTRSYSLLLLGLFAACALVAMPASRSRTVLLTLTLSALPQVHLFGSLMAVVLLGYDMVVRRRFATSHIVVVISVALAAWQLWHPDARVVAPSAFSDLRHAVASGFFPTFVFEPWPSGSAREPLGLLLAAAAMVVLTLRRGAWAIAAPLLGGLLLICAFVYSGHRWHYGFFFIFFVAALWLAPEVRQRRTAWSLTTLIFFVQAWLGVRALVRDVREPYSSGADAAAALTEAGLGEAPLVGLSFRTGAPRCLVAWNVDELQPVMAVRRRGAYDPVTKHEEPFWKHYADPGHYPTMSIPDALAQLADRAPAERVALVAMGDVPADCTVPLERLSPLPPPLPDYGERYTLFRAGLPHAPQ